MKRHLVLTLRLVIAAVGIGFIVWSLTWVDHVRLPAGYELPDGGVLREPVQAEVLSDTSRIDPNKPIMVELPASVSAESRQLAIDPNQIGTAAHEIQYEPGVTTTLREAKWALLAIGLILVAVVPTVQTVRWRLLMRCRGLDPGYVQSFRLVLVGMFFNFSLPGMTGGDLVKAYYAAKGAHDRGAAVMSVVLDRVTGLIGLTLLGGLAGLVALAWLDRPLLGQMTVAIWIVLVGMAVAGHLYMSDRLRRHMAPLGARLGSLLPGTLIQRIDQAAFAYRRHLGAVYLAVVVSVPVHLAQMVATGLAGQALGMETSLLVLVPVLSVVFMVGAMPISYQGLGVMEAAAMALLLTPQAESLVTANQIVGMLMLGRMYLLVYSLLGSGVLLHGGIHLFPQHVAEAMAKPQ